MRSHRSMQTHVLIIVILWGNILLPCIIFDTLVKASHGLTSVQNLSTGDILVGYSNNKTTNVSITHITTTTTNTLITITTNKGNIYALPDQRFYDPVLQKWIQAKNITTNTVFLDSKFNHITCINAQTTSISPKTVYHISTTNPHNFFATEQELLTHNAFPLVALGVSWLFGLGSVEFAGLSLATLLGSTAIGVKLFKKQGKQNQSFTIRPQGSGSYGGFNPDPKDDDNNSNTERICNTITKTEFFKSISKEYEYWRDNIYKRKHKAKGLDKKTEYLKWDHLHNDVEAYDKWGKHLGSYNPKTLQLYKQANPLNTIPVK